MRARSIPALIAVPADPAGDAALVERLARWAGRWSPLVEVDGDGWAAARRHRRRASVRRRGGAGRAICETRFAALGLTARVAIAPTAAAAWALARLRHCRRGRCCGKDAGAKLAAPARRRAAACRRRPTRTLERLGLKTIGALAGVPRRALARRFREADNPVDALDRALGPQGRAADRRAVRAAAARHAPAGRAGDASRSAGPGAGAADPRPRRGSWSARQLGARRLALTGLPGRRQRRRRRGRDRHPQPRAEASAAAARRQGGGARSRLRLRRLRARGELVRAAGRGAGQPGRGAVAASARWRGWSTG